MKRWRCFHYFEVKSSFDFATKRYHPQEELLIFDSVLYVFVFLEDWGMRAIKSVLVVAGGFKRDLVFSKVVNATILK